MLIGLPKETKDHETRVGMTPSTVRALTRSGHEVRVQRGAGEGSFLADEEYVAAGAVIVPQAEDAWAAHMVVKVKEPTPAEYRYLIRE